MISAFVVFGILYALISIFERKYGTEPDGFVIFTAVVAPTIVVFLIRLAGVFLELLPWSEIAATGIYPIITALVLWKVVDIPLKRSIVYAALSFVTCIGVEIGLGLLVATVA